MTGTGRRLNGGTGDEPADGPLRPQVRGWLFTEKTVQNTDYAAKGANRGPAVTRRDRRSVAVNVVGRR